ncbi:hypothetical protein DEU29_11181, partial [Idiomarina aquatica]
LCFAHCSVQYQRGFGDLINANRESSLFIQQGRLQPIDYLMSLFKQWPLINDSDNIDHLLPWNIELTP